MAYPIALVVLGWRTAKALQDSRDIRGGTGTPLTGAPYAVAVGQAGAAAGSVPGLALGQGPGQGQGLGQGQGPGTVRAAQAAGSAALHGLDAGRPAARATAAPGWRAAPHQRRGGGR
jgi:hypothetical protein